MLVAEVYLANVWEQAVCDLPNPVDNVWLLDASPQLIIHCRHHLPRHKPAGQELWSTAFDAMQFGIQLGFVFVHWQAPLAISVTAFVLPSVTVEGAPRVGVEWGQIQRKGCKGWRRRSRFKGSRGRAEEPGGGGGWERRGEREEGKGERGKEGRGRGRGKRKGARVLKQGWTVRRLAEA